MNKKKLFYISGAIAVYFVFLVANAHWTLIENTLLGIIQESITIPLLAIQLIISIISFVQVLKLRFKIRSWEFWTFIISTVNFLVATGSIILYLLM